MKTTTFTVPATVMHFEAGDALFCYLSYPIGGIPAGHEHEGLIQTTLLCEVIGSEIKHVGKPYHEFDTMYDLVIKDAQNPDLVGRTFTASTAQGYFSTRQVDTNYFYQRNGFTAQPQPLRLIKQIRSPETSFLTIENEILHLGAKGEYSSSWYPMDLFEAAEIERLRELLPVIASTLYCTIDIDDCGNKIKGLSVTYRNGDTEETWGIPM